MDTFSQQDGHNLQPGYIIDGYKIIEEINRGGMGIVYKALETHSERVVALKVLFEYKNKTSQKRFLREAQLSAKLQHDNIVKVYSAGEHNGKMYLVMEYIEGDTLHELIHKEKIPWQEGITILSQIANALGYAHKKNIIHRDVKPENIIVQKNGQAKIMDFGLAKSMHLGEYSLTKTGEAIGTPRYMCIEQLTGKSRDLTHKVDIYALGTILYEIVAKIPMIPGATSLQILYNIEHFKPEPLNKYEQDIPPALETVLRKAIADKRYRYENMQLFMDDLQNALDNKKVTRSRNISLKTILLASLILTIFSTLVLIAFSHDPSSRTPKENITSFTLYLQAISDFDIGQYEKAYQVFQNLQEKESFRMLSFYIGACLYHQEVKKEQIDKEKIQLAIDYLAKSAAFFPYHTEIFFVLGKCYFLLEKYSEAKSFFNKCIQLAPEAEHFNYLAQINFNQSEYETCFQNLKNVIALDQGNVQASNLLLELSVKAPQLQGDNWQLLEHMFFSLKAMPEPRLFDKDFLVIENKNYNHYMSIFSDETKKEDHKFFVYLAAKAYLSNKQNDIQKLEKGHRIFCEILENKEENVFIRYLAAKSLISLYDFEYLHNFLLKNYAEMDFIGNIIVSNIMRKENIIADIANSFLYLSFSEQNNLSETEKEFIDTLIAQSFYNLDIEHHHDKVNPSDISFLQKLINSNSLKTKLAAASSAINLMGISTPIGTEAFSIITGMLEPNTDTHLRTYAYYYLLNSYSDKKNNYDYKNIYEKGLSDSEQNINMICLSFLHKFTKVELPKLQFPGTEIIMFFNPGSIRIVNRDFFFSIEELLFSIANSSKSSELRLRAACIWALALPNTTKFLNFLEKETTSSLLRLISMRYYMFASWTTNEQGGSRYAAYEIFRFLKRKDTLVLANINFIITTFIPFVRIENNMDEQMLMSVLNAVKFSAANRVDKKIVSMFAPNYEERTKSTLSQYIWSSSKLIQQASISSLIAIQTIPERIAFCEELLQSDNSFAQRGASDGLYRINRNEIVPFAKDIPRFFLYLSHYQPFYLEKYYDEYTKDFFSLQEKTTNIFARLNYAIDLYNKDAKLYYERALIYLANDKLDEARKDLEKASTLLPENFRYTVDLATVEYELKNLERCKALIQTIKQEQNPYILRKLATLYYKMGQYKEARRVYKKLFSLSPYEKEHLLNIIKIFCIENDKSNALLYTKWLKNICDRKYINTLDHKDNLSKIDFNFAVFDVIKNEKFITSLPE